MEGSAKRDVGEWSHQDVLHWLITQDLGNIITSVHKLNWSGIELIEMASDFQTHSVDTTATQVDFPQALHDLDGVDDATKKTVLKRVARLVAQSNSEQTSQLHGWNFEKDWHEWRTLLEEWQYAEIVNVERRNLQRLDHQFSIAVLLVSTVATTWTAATFGREQKQQYYYPTVTLFFSCLLTTLTGYLKLSGLKAQLEAAYATHEHQLHVNDFILTQLSMRPEARHHYEEYKQELHALLENRNEHASVLDITTSDRMKIVKHIRKHEDEIYRQLWGPYPGFHQKIPQEAHKDPLKEAHERDANKGAYFEWHNDPDHDAHGFHLKSLAALNHLSGGLLLRYWPLHKPLNKEESQEQAKSFKRSSSAFARMGSRQDLKFDAGGEEGGLLQRVPPATRSPSTSDGKSAISDGKAFSSVSSGSDKKSSSDRSAYRRDEKRFAPPSESGSKV